MAKQKSQARSGPRARQFSIVIHDVKPQAKAYFEKLLPPLMLDWFLVAEEAYTHQSGTHIHIFLRYAHPQAKFRILEWIQKQEQGGRVQVDIGRGAFQQCKKYLVDPDKEKNCDEIVTENVRNLTLVEKYPDLSDKCVKCGMLFYNPPFNFTWEGRSEWKYTDRCSACTKDQHREWLADFLRRKFQATDSEVIG